MQKRVIFFFFVPLLLFAENSASLLLPAEAAAPKPDCMEVQSCIDAAKSGNLQLKYRGPGGIGYPDGYGSLDFFYAPQINEQCFSFIDLRSHLFQDGKWAANAGLGVRYLPECKKVIYGLNAYWDWRETKHTRFQQIGAGLEFLGARWDAYINGYVPYNRQKHGYQTGFLKFKGNQAIVYKKYEVALSGLDAGIGYWVWDSGCFDLHATLGGYYFQGDLHRQAVGGLINAKMLLTEWVEVGAQVSYDTLFKWNAQGEIALRIPFGKKIKTSPCKKRACSNDLARRLAAPPERFEIIVSTSHKKKTVALHPDTENPLFFVFVDNLSGSNGTIESPFPTLQQAQLASGPENAIYLFPGDGTDQGMNSGVVLQNYQIFAGSGAPLEVQSRFGAITIPAQSSSLPNISNTGNTVTLANGNRISGLHITSSSSHGIADADFVTNVNIQQTRIDAAGRGIFFNDTFNGQFILRDSQISATDEAILFFQAFNGNCSLAHNQLTSSASTAIAFAHTFDGEFNSSSNAISGLEGLHFQRNFTGNFLASNNQITATTLAGVLFENSGSQVFTGNLQASNNQIDGFIGGFICLQGITGDWAFTNNTIDAQTREGIFFIEFDGNFTANNNTITTFGAVNSAAIEIAQAAAHFNGTATINNNTLVQTNAASNTPTLNVASSNLTAQMNGNTASTASTGLAAQIGHASLNTSHLQFMDNTLTSAGAVDGNFINVSGVFEVESPDSTLSGLNAINTGVITTTGAVTFVPLQ